ncbi:MAG: HAF repeat-containing protein [Thiobacillus sp.]|nr:HAF repeat-containing protein [Thiobacillus sp.]
MNRKQNRGWWALLSVLSLGGVAPASWAWTIEDLGDLPGGSSFSEGHGLNETGDVVGYGTAAATNEAFVWKRGVGMSALARPAGSAYCTAHGINDTGLAAGFCDGGTTNKRVAMVWRSGTPAAIAFDSTTLSSEALAVNALGEVSGTYRGRIARAPLLDQAFTVDTRIVNAVARGITPLPADLGGSGRGNAINSQGYIAGNAIQNRGFVGGGINQPSHQPYLWNPAINIGAIVAVGILPNATAKHGEARGINDSRQVVGLYDNRGFLWTPGSPQQMVGTTVPITIEPYDINNRGQIVGVSRGKAQLYTVSSGAVTDLGALPEVRAAGWKSLSIARAINDNGQITGTGVNGAGEVHAYLLSPGNPLRPVKPGRIRDRVQDRILSPNPRR